MNKENLDRNIELLKRQQYWLSISYKEVKQIGIKKQYSIDEFGRFETLCSRFARSIDFLVRKLYRAIDEYEFETQGTLIDVINRAHKRGLLESIEEIRIIKDIRNTITHEYVEEGLIAIFNDVLDYAPHLLALMEKSIEYHKVKY
jgi:hypothetical protein